jgi:hypothetical protein
MNRFNLESKIKFFLEQQKRFNYLYEQLSTNDKEKQILQSSVEESKQVLIGNK